MMSEPRTNLERAGMNCQMSDGSAVFRLDLDTDIGESHHDAKWISIDSSQMPSANRVL